MKRALAAGAVLLVLAVLAAVGWRAWLHAPWTAWAQYRDAFIEADGRVVDRTTGGRTVSEGQAYALFFALVANDRPSFERILGWTEAQLCAGDCGRQLPSWLWGDRGAEGWGVIDPNAASDADLWIAYSLLEAARLWKAPAYGAKARALLGLIAERETLVSPTAGVLLLPGPTGFSLDEGSAWRLNPSYLPEFQLRYLAAADAAGPWAAILRTYLAQAPQVFAQGYAPDWYELGAQGQVSEDRSTQGLGSYDAIRVYLWSGMTPDSALIGLLHEYAEQTLQRGAPPEKIDARQGAVDGWQPLGFSAAVLPFLKSLGEDRAVLEQRKRLEANRQGGLLGQPARYYDQVLALFGEGWSDGRFSFDETGHLKPRWESQCCGR